MIREQSQAGPVGAAVARNMRTIRNARGWSASELATRIAIAGCAMGRSVIANLESGRRAVVTVDELAALGVAFDVEPWSLTTDTPICVACKNTAPPGFACLTCGQGRSSTHA